MQYMHPATLHVNLDCNKHGTFPYLQGCLIKVAAVRRKVEGQFNRLLNLDNDSTTPDILNSRPPSKSSQEASPPECRTTVLSPVDQQSGSLNDVSIGSPIPSDDLELAPANAVQLPDNLATAPPPEETVPRLQPPAETATQGEASREAASICPTEEAPRIGSPGEEDGSGTIKGPVEFATDRAKTQQGGDRVLDEAQSDQRHRLEREMDSEEQCRALDPRTVDECPETSDREIVEHETGEADNSESMSISSMSQQSPSGNEEAKLPDDEAPDMREHTAVVRDTVPPENSSLEHVSDAPALVSSLTETESIEGLPDQQEPGSGQQNPLTEEPYVPLTSRTASSEDQLNSAGPQREGLLAGDSIVPQETSLLDQTHPQDASRMPATEQVPRQVHQAQVIGTGSQDAVQAQKPDSWVQSSAASPNEPGTDPGIPSATAELDRTDCEHQIGCLSVGQQETEQAADDRPPSGGYSVADKKRSVMDVLVDASFLASMAMPTSQVWIKSSPIVLFSHF